MAYKYPSKAAARRASRKRKAIREMLPEQFDPIVSIASHQPDDRPRSFFVSQSWVTVPPTVERTSRKVAKPSFADSITGASTVDDTRTPSGEGHRTIRKSMGA